MENIVEKILQTNKNICVIMAGPGTGKSHTFKKIVEHPEYQNKKILILSFINNLVNDLAKDFKDFNNVEVKTLHSLAWQILSPSQDILIEERIDDILSKDFSIIKGGECNYKKRFEKNTLEEEEVKFYKDRKSFYEKGDKKLYSFNSIVYTCNKAFENKNNIQTYDLILVDEFQDFNPLECRMIELLAEKNEIVIVGDDYQALYGFKGATPQSIRDKYNNSETESITLPNCYRCTRVIVDAVKDVIKNAKEEGFLKDAVEKEYNYPNRKDKDKISKMYPCIEHRQGVAGKKLFDFLAKKIKKDTDDAENKRILILSPKYMIQQLTDGIIKKELNVVKVELLSKQKQEVLTVLKAFEVLKKTKTNNFALRCILHKYMNEEQIVGVVKQSHKSSKKIWSILTEEVKKKIENDIELYKKCATSTRKVPTSEEREDFIRNFDINIPIKTIIDGVGPISKGAIEVEIVTPMSSKGLSADYVYYLVDDEYTLEKIGGESELTDTKVCEFIVGITRAKEKLTLISTKDETPKVLNLIERKKIKKI